MKTLKGPGIFLAQYAGNSAPFDTLPNIARWASSLGFAGVQIPSNDTRLFDLYSQQFGNGRPAAADFDQHIQGLKAQYEGRRDDILQIFQERLDVDNFDFGVPPTDALHAGLRDVSLNLLDGLEKFTSPTVARTEHGIELRHPMIADPAKRNPFVVSIKSEEEREKSLGHVRIWQIAGIVICAVIAVVLLYVTFTSGPPEMATSP